MGISPIGRIVKTGHIHWYDSVVLSEGCKESKDGLSQSLGPSGCVKPGSGTGGQDLSEKSGMHHLETKRLVRNHVENLGKQIGYVGC